MDGGRVRTEKGQVDLITLAIGMVPMILFIILSGYILVENPVETDLSTQMSFEEARFESIMALNHILVYNDTLERINNYSEFPAYPDRVKAIIESDINESTNYLGDTTEDRHSRPATYRGRTGRHIRNTLSDWIDRKFVVNITMPEEDNISVSTPDTSGAFITSKVNIASPKPEPITVKVVLDRG